jgi:hypothetical protein
VFPSTAFAEGLNLVGAVFENSHLEEGDFSRANFDGATFVNCNLNRVNLVGASFHVKEITETVVYGIAAWDLQTSDDMKQCKLVIERTYELYSDLIQQGKVPMMVDDIELAQFVHYLSNHKKMRDALNVLNDRGVLLLGRFKDRGLDRLYSMRECFQAKGYMPMIFDFARPDNLSLTETVMTMAGLSKFVVVDLSGSSVPAELQAILGQIKKPVLARGAPYALFPDLADQAKVLTVKGDESDLLGGLEDNLSELERLHAQRIMQLAKRCAKTADQGI